MFADHFFSLGEQFYDVVTPANVKDCKLRWHNPELFKDLDLHLSEKQMIKYLGHFEPLPDAVHPPLAQRYIGYQLQVFNPNLGDGRGFLLAQRKAKDGAWLDLSTKGSGTTPYSRGGDGMLTLKGGVREIIAAEFLHAMGVKTSRPLTLVEHDAKLYRSDEPSPTRAGILVRVGEGHIRFGSFERIYYRALNDESRSANTKKLAEHVIALYYPELATIQPEAKRYTELFRSIVHRTARLVAQWMRAGFCHGVLNTDNMNVTGDSFDYGPYAFIDAYDPDFTAAYFDTEGLYAFGKQASVCHWNLSMLVLPFSIIAPEEALKEALQDYWGEYEEALRAAMLPRLGFIDNGSFLSKRLMKTTWSLLDVLRPSYHGFFQSLTTIVSSDKFQEHPAHIPFCPPETFSTTPRKALDDWQHAWKQCQDATNHSIATIANTLEQNNPCVVPLRPEIERVWEAIERKDDWKPLTNWIHKLQHPF